MILMLFAAFIPSAVGAANSRVLVVTTEQYNIPSLSSSQDGETVVGDLTAAGLPFDVVTYGRFVDPQPAPQGRGIALANYDVIILNGHTSPTPLADVTARCQAAIQGGSKVFINGDYPYCRFDASGQLTTKAFYSCSLFDVIDGGYMPCSGPVSLPASIEKDPSISRLSIPSCYIHTFKFKSGRQPSLAITVKGSTVGFLCPQGGVLSAANEQMCNLLDYGKVVNYLRYGSSETVGFALDRIDGKPVAAFEVHCDATQNLTAISKLSDLATQFNIPLVNCLVYSNLNSAATSKWNSVAQANPLMRIGSHSRTHPQDWPSLPNIIYESADALTVQKVIIPSTTRYLAFSGSMNPTSAQIDQIYNASPQVLFDAKGYDSRAWRDPATNSWTYVQNLPTCQDWLHTLSQATSAPFCLAQTIDSDYNIWYSGRNYLDEIKKEFAPNKKYGLYSFGYIHDYMLDPSTNFYSGGVHVSQLIKSALQYLQDQGVKFIGADDMVSRLRDFSTGSIYYTSDICGNLTVTVYRPGAKINQVKIENHGDLAAVATGCSVVSQRRTGNFTYIDLSPEVTSTFTVSWLAIPPDPPIVSAPDYVGSQLSAQWGEQISDSGVVEYRYAIGYAPDQNDVVDWTSSGTNTNINLNLPFPSNGRDYYVSVISKGSHGLWSDPGVSHSIRSDCTPPLTPAVAAMVDDDASGSTVRAYWETSDPESGIVDIHYALGTAPGKTDIIPWTDAGVTDQVSIHKSWTTYGLCYVSVQSKNALNVWSDVASSDAIMLSGPKNVSGAKGYRDGTNVNILDVQVTAVFADCTYVEQSDRSSGIKLEKPYGDFAVGKRVNISGAIKLANNERYVAQPYVTLSFSPTLPAIRPVFIKNSSLGGAAFNTFTPGLPGGTGLNNIGLFVATAGHVTFVGANYFYIDDGSGICDDPVHVGLRVDGSSLANMPAVGDFVSVSGISSVDMTSGTARRLLRATSWSDI